MVVKLVLWLCARFDIHTIEAERLKHSSNAVERGMRWEGFYREEGGLADMLATIRKNYFEAASALGHRDDDKLYEFVVADRCARELEREVLQIVATGKAVAERQRHVEREEAARILRAI